MVEPLEETRTELIFATEPILSSLELSIPGAGRHMPLVELDEVEVPNPFYFLTVAHSKFP
jgi:SCY1-like protein 2